MFIPRAKWLTSGLAFCIFLASYGAHSTELKVAVASNFYHSLTHLIKVTEPKGMSLKLSSGSTGLLYGQITKGAPYDVFLSADIKRPKLLENNGLAHSRVTYAYGQLVLWPSPFAIKKALTSLEGKLVIAHPKLAPYGEAAQSVLQYLSLEERFNGRLIKANNINQAFQFVDSGNAPLAILSRSQLIHARMASEAALNKQLDNKTENKYSRFQSIPSEWHQPIAQQAVIIERTNNLLAAKAFMTWLLSEPVQSQLMTLGYKTDK